MKMKYKLINTAGQLTPIIEEPTPRSKQPGVSAKFLSLYPNAGQVAFIEKSRKFPGIYRAQMMGGELSINGSLATAYFLAKRLNKKQLTLEISGLNQKVLASLGNGTISILFPQNIVKSIKNNIVSLRGIKYWVKKDNLNKKFLTRIEQSRLNQLVQNCPAAGICFYKDKRLKLVVKVKATKSLVWETACGSGSLAYYLITGNSQPTQPSNMVIKILKTNNDKLKVTVPVKEV